MHYVTWSVDLINPFMHGEFQKYCKKTVFVCLTLKRHKNHKNGARKFGLKANCRKFSLLSFWYGNYVFIVNGFLAMTSQRWVGDFNHLSGQHAGKSYNELYPVLFKNVCSEHIH